MRALRVLFYIIIVLVVISIAAGRFFISKTVEGEGPSIERTFAETDFSGIKVAGPWDIVIEPGQSHAVAISAEENLFEYIKVEVDNGHLRIKTTANLRSPSGLKLTVAAPSFEAVHIAGSVKLRSTGMLRADKVDLDMAGSSDVDMDLAVTDFSLEGAGSSRATLRGTGQTASFDIAGSGEVLAENFQLQNLEIDVAGSGKVACRVATSLDVDIAGSGEVQYHGQPQVSQDIAGSGSIRQLSGGQEDPADPAPLPAESY